MPAPAAPARAAVARRGALVVTGAVCSTLVLLVVLLGLPAPTSVGAQAGAQAGPPQGAPEGASTGTPPRVRAFGDSVTAGFGFLADGSPWGVVDLLRCRPTLVTQNDRCSSNSSLGPGATDRQPSFSADFGLANQVSWAAQVAGALGATDYANYAVTGSEPRHWMELSPEPGQADNGTLHDLLVRLERDDPDLVLVTLGANPLLADFLTGPGKACAVFSDEATERQLFVDCIDGYVDANLVQQRLMAVYLDVLAHTTDAKILVSRYHLALSALSLFDEWQSQVMVDAVNGQVERAVAAVKESGAVWASRIAVSDPPRFDTGWPGTGAQAGCGATPAADGPSRQALSSQAVLIARAGSAGFCPSAAPWIIDADTGIHPNRAGHAQFAASALAVVRANGWATAGG